MSMQILAVRVGRVGDTVMMTPALTALLQYYPDAEITLLLSPAGKLLLKDFHPNIKDIWTWDRSGIFKPLEDKNRILQNLKASHFDKIICFDTSPRIAALFDGIDSEFHQYTGSKVLTHCAKAYLDFLADACSQPVVDTYNFLPVDKEARRDVDEELAKHGIGGEDTVLMIHPTFSGYSRFAMRKRKAKLRKLWSPDNYGTLIKKISTIETDKGSAIKSIMVLLPDELSFGEMIVKHSDGKVLLLRSESTFERYKAMINRADVLLTPDSGPMHMASALGTRIVAFFSMKDPGDCGPYMDPSKFIILRSEDTTQPEKGINAIDIDTVFNACKRLLANNKATSTISTQYKQRSKMIHGSNILISSIIISVYKDAAALRLILDSLQKQTVNNFEIIVSEDGRCDDIKQCVGDYRKTISDLQHLSQEDDGFRKTVALNRAIKACNTDHIIFIDGDCVPHRAFIAAHQAFAAPGVACTGRRVEIGEKISDKLRNRGLDLACLINRLRYLMNSISLLLDKTKNIECGLYSRVLHAATKNRKIRLLGSNFSCNKRDLIKINGFNEDYLSPGFGEDSDIDWRLRQSGVIVKNVKFSAVQYHLHHNKDYHPSEVNMAIYKHMKESGDFSCKNGLSLSE